MKAAHKIMHVSSFLMKSSQVFSNGCIIDGTDDATPIDALLDPQWQVKRTKLQLGLIVRGSITTPYHVSESSLNLTDSWWGKGAVSRLCAKQETNLARGIGTYHERTVSRRIEADV